MTANAKSQTYGTANPALDATVTGAVNGDVLNYSLATTAAQTSGVGSYPITVTLGHQPELHVTKTDGTLTVGPAVATVTANAKSKTYGDGQPGARRDGDRRGQRRRARLHPGDDGADDQSGVGSYPITVTLGANPNYTVTTTDAR